MNCFTPGQLRQAQIIFKNKWINTSRPYQAINLKSKGWINSCSKNLGVWMLHIAHISEPLANPKKLNEERKHSYGSIQSLKTMTRGVTIQLSTPVTEKRNIPTSEEDYLVDIDTITMIILCLIFTQNTNCPSSLSVANFTPEKQLNPFSKSHKSLLKKEARLN